MDHFRGSQPPASHSVPGALGLPGPDRPPHIGTIDPLAFIPAAFLNDILATIRNEFSSRDWDIKNRYLSITQGYREMAEEFKRSVQQTDKILLEQHSRFESRLKEIRNDTRQFHNNQMTTLTVLKERLDALEVLTEASRSAMDSRIATVIETMERGSGAGSKNNGHGVPLRLESGVSAYDTSLGGTAGHADGAAHTTNNGYESRFANIAHGSKGALFPAAWSQTESETDTTTAHVFPSRPLIDSGCSRENSAPEHPSVAILNEPKSLQTSLGDNTETDEQDELYDGDTPQISTPATEEPLAPPAIDMAIIEALSRINCSEAISPLPPVGCGPSQDPLENPLQDPPQDFPSQDPLFDALSPLTQIATPCSGEPEEPQTPTMHCNEEMCPENASPASHPSPLNNTSRRRKRTSRGVTKSRKSKKPRREQDADPSIWPPVTEGGADDQQYVGCDHCAGWYHRCCAGLRKEQMGHQTGSQMQEDGVPWQCPPCMMDPTRGVVKGFQEGRWCLRPGCDLSKDGEYFMVKLVGRCYDLNAGVMKYLVVWEGYSLDQCTWEPANNFGNDSTKIEEFLDSWAAENANVDMDSLNPYETILLRVFDEFRSEGMIWYGV